MTLIVLGTVVALAAAARSTWSPCGLSMLSQLTPLAEAGRRHRWAPTAGWFVAGAALGGLTLGAVMALGAALVGALGVSANAALVLTAVLALAAAATDAELFSAGPPWLCRQVNEAWLSQYRRWVYASGFGWQIGAGLTTYVMTAAVPLMMLIGALTGNPAVAFAIGGLFGLTRGSAVLLGARIRTPDALFAAHRHFDALTTPVRDVAIVVQLAVAVSAGCAGLPFLAAIAVCGAAIAVATQLTTRPLPRREQESNLR